MNLTKEAATEALAAYTANEENNLTAENFVLLARTFGDREAEEIACEYELAVCIGNATPEDFRKAFEACNTYHARLVEIAA